jgi:methionyl-tRNA synthetase
VPSYASGRSSTSSRASRKAADELFDPAAVPQTNAPQRHAEKQQHQCKGPRPERTISIEDFAKLDLRVAKITRAEQVEGADKLVKLSASTSSVRWNAAPCSPGSSPRTDPDLARGQARRSVGRISRRAR